MSSNRPSRNPQQMRSLIQNMGRSIDEARLRRLGPSLGTSGSQGSRAPMSSQGLDTRIGTSSSTDAPTTGSGSTPASNSPPPIRSATEMFTDSQPRLKARPQRAS
jgi:hypothetical protein